MFALRPIKKFFILMLLILLAAIVTGYIFGINNPDENRAFIRMVLGSFGGFSEKSKLSVLLFIFLNNSIKSFFAMVSGIFFGLITINFIFLNGILIGMVAALSRTEFGITYFLAGTLPHGIIELFGILVASSYGLWLGAMFARWMFLKDKSSLRIAWKFSIMNYFKIVLPLLIAAALIETFITPYFISMAS